MPTAVVSFVVVLLLSFSRANAWQSALHHDQLRHPKRRKIPHWSPVRFWLCNAFASTKPLTVFPKDSGGASLTLSYPHCQPVTLKGPSFVARTYITPDVTVKMWIRRLMHEARCPSDKSVRTKYKLLLRKVLEVTRVAKLPDREPQVPLMLDFAGATLIRANVGPLLKKRRDIQKRVFAHYNTKLTKDEKHVFHQTSMVKTFFTRPWFKHPIMGVMISMLDDTEMKQIGEVIHEVAPKRFKSSKARLKASGVLVDRLRDAENERKKMGDATVTWKKQKFLGHNYNDVSMRLDTMLPRRKTDTTTYFVLEYEHEHSFSNSKTVFGKIREFLKIQKQAGRRQG